MFKQTVRLMLVIFSLQAPFNFAEARSHEKRAAKAARKQDRKEAKLAEVEYKLRHVDNRMSLRKERRLNKKAAKLRHKVRVQQAKVELHSGASRDPGEYKLQKQVVRETKRASKDQLRMDKSKAKHMYKDVSLRKQEKLRQKNVKWTADMNMRDSRIAALTSDDKNVELRNLRFQIAQKEKEFDILEGKLANPYLSRRAKSNLQEEFGIVSNELNRLYALNTPTPAIADANEGAVPPVNDPAPKSGPKPASDSINNSPDFFEDTAPKGAQKDDGPKGEPAPAPNTPPTSGRAD
jgi:hypothetical protein